MHGGIKPIGGGMKPTHAFHYVVLLYNAVSPGPTVGPLFTRSDSHTKVNTNPKPKTNSLPNTKPDPNPILNPNLT